MRIVGIDSELVRRTNKCSVPLAACKEIRDFLRSRGNDTRIIDAAIAKATINPDDPDTIDETAQAIIESGDLE